MKVYVYPADLYGCGHYRLIWPAMVLQNDPNIDITIVRPGESTFLAALAHRDGTVKEVMTPPDADVIVLQRPTYPFLANAVALMRKKGIAVVVDIDDDLAHIDPGNPAWIAMHPDQSYKREMYALQYERSGDIETAKRVRRGEGTIAPHSWKAVEQACRDATLVTVSTPPLTSSYGRGNGVVIPNYVPENFLNVPHEDTTILGWAGSTHSHPGDLAAMGNAVRTVMHSDNAQIMIIGNSDGADRELGLNEPVPCSGVVDFDKWISAVTQIGIGVAPLANTRFNRAKSWLKALEYSAAGVPWVASALPEYTRLASLGAGVVVDRPKDWTRALQKMVRDDAYRLESSAAVRSVATDLTVEANAWRLAEAWSTAVQRQRGLAVPGTVAR